MAQMTVRKLDDRVYRHLKRRAKANGRSLEAETREILSNEAARDVAMVKFAQWSKAVRAKQKVPKDWDSTAMIRADRDSDYKAGRE
jgi:plasmid stability protein